MCARARATENGEVLARTYEPFVSRGHGKLPRLGNVKGFLSLHTCAIPARAPPTPAREDAVICGPRRSRRGDRPTETRDGKGLTARRGWRSTIVQIISP
jgi:hypothetical protein